MLDKVDQTQVCKLTVETEHRWAACFNEVHPPQTLEGLQDDESAIWRWTRWPLH